MTTSIETFLSAEEIQTRVQDLGEQIRKDYKGSPSLVVLGVLNGSFMFYSDLVRAIQRPLVCDFIRISSYGMERASSGSVVIRKDIEVDIQDRDVLIVEDIVDSGLSLQRLREHLQTRRPKSLRICSLLKRHTAPEPVDYCGFEIGDGFVAGYGIDCAEQYRELPYIGIVA